MRRLRLLLLVILVHETNALEVCGYPNGAYCVRKSDDHYSEIVFRPDFYNTTKFSWPDMGMVNMMHDKVVDFDRIRVIDFSSNCYWVFSWRMSLEWTARSLREIRFASECRHWARVFGYCVNVPLQWRRRLRLENAELCSIEDPQHRSWMESDQANSLEEELESTESDVRVVRNLPFPQSEEKEVEEEVERSEKTALHGVGNRVEFPPIADEYATDDVEAEVRQLRAELEHARTSFEAQIDLLRHQLDVCRSTVQQMGQFGCAGSSQQGQSPIHRLPVSSIRELQQLQSRLADATARIARLLLDD